MKYVYVPVYARTVLFSAQSNRFLDHLLTIACNDAVKQFVSRLRSHIINYYPTTDMHVRYAKGKDPAWVGKALRRGEVIYNISLSDKDYAKYKNYILYLNTLPEEKVASVSVRDLDKNMASFAQSVAEQALVDSPENCKTLHEYEDGYRWVQPISHAAKSYEARLMNNGIYREATAEESADAVIILSLRDKENRPHVNIEIANGVVSRVLGINGFPVDEVDLPYVLDCFRKQYVPFDTVLSEAFLKNQFFYFDSKAVSFKDFEGQFNGDIQLSHCNDAIQLPENLNITGDLDLSNSVITELPNHLTVKGKLNLANSRISVIPEDLTVSTLDLTNTNIAHLPSSLPNVRQIIIGKDTKILSLPVDFDLPVGSLKILPGSRITTLPLKMNIGKNLVIRSNRITNLPRELTVGKGLYLDGSSVTISRLPDELKSKLK